MKFFLSGQTREDLDVNGDGLSDLPQLRSANLGMSAFYRHGSHSKLNVDLFAWTEDRQGGNMTSSEPHKNALSEWTNHRVIGGHLSEIISLKNGTLTHKFDLDGQYTLRNSYYGSGFTDFQIADLDPATQDSLRNISKENYAFLNNNLIGGGDQLVMRDQRRTWILGLDARKEELKEDLNQLDGSSLEKENRISQSQKNLSAYGQLKWHLSSTFLVDLGLRYDRIDVRLDQRTVTSEPDQTNACHVLSPKAGIKKDISKNLIMRASYSFGFRAPMMYDEDLHSSIVDREVLRVIMDPNLREKTAHSFFINQEYQKSNAETGHRFVVEGFYTLINDRFYHQPIWSNGEAFILKSNAEYNAQVYGLNLKGERLFSPSLRMDISATAQQSVYTQAIEVYADEEINLYEQDILRSPNLYGSYTLQYDFGRYNMTLVDGAWI